MKTHSFTAHTLNDTIEFAVKCANEAKYGDIITLSGPMGAGKSEFARAFIRHLLNNEILDVPSPTFTLVQTYETKNFPIWHFDLYRLEDAEEIYEIGWEEAISEGLCLIEWPEKLGDLLSSSHKQIVIEPINDQARKIKYTHDHNGVQT